jgi:hypothetical protein
MSTTQKTLIVKLFGNLGGNPELRSNHDQVITRSVHDATIDDAVAEPFRLGDFARIRFTGKGLFAEYLLSHWLEWDAILRCPDLDERNQRGSSPRFASATRRPPRP